MADQPTFCERVTQRCGDDFKRCSQCVNCSTQCPFAAAMRHGPNGIIRLIQYNLELEVLESPDIWPCIHCRGCAIVCPMAIDIPALMAALREMAIEEGVGIDEKAIARFHRLAANLKPSDGTGD